MAAFATLPLLRLQCLCCAADVFTQADSIPCWYEAAAQEQAATWFLALLRQTYQWNTLWFLGTNTCTLVLSPASAGDEPADNTIGQSQSTQQHKQVENQDPKAQHNTYAETKTVTKNVVVLSRAAVQKQEAQLEEQQAAYEILKAARQEEEDLLHR